MNGRRGRFVCLVVDSYPSFLPVESTNRKIESYLDGSTMRVLPNLVALITKGLNHFPSTSIPFKYPDLLEFALWAVSSIFDEEFAK